MGPRQRQDAVVFRFARTADGKPADPGHGNIGIVLVDPSPTLGRKQHVAQFIPEQDRDSGCFAGQPAERKVCQRGLLIREQPRGRDRSVRDERHQRACPSWRHERISAVVTFFCIALSRRRVAHSAVWS